MKYRLVKTTKRDGDVIFYTQHEIKLPRDINGRWLSVSDSCSSDLDTAKEIYNKIINGNFVDKTEILFENETIQEGSN